MKYIRLSLFEKLNLCWNLYKGYATSKPGNIKIFDTIFIPPIFV